MEHLSEKKLSNSIKKLSFEQAIQELESIVNALDSNTVTLDQSIEFYSKGVELRKHCENILNDAKIKVQKIIADEGNIQNIKELDIA